MVLGDFGFGYPDKISMGNGSLALWDSANSGFSSLYFRFFLFQKQDCSSNFDRTGRCICKFAGVDSVSVNSEENKVVVIGDGIDAVDLVIKLRKFCDAELISMGPARNEKKIAPNNDHAIRYQNALAELTKSYQANPERYFGRCYNWRG
ncbi:hypothetical protein OIU84_008157 [Salix udensis]|uniref:Uncharacterized protein n=1 Tax=Salix udensis TaxID=889485 RepID=A0AAD6P0B0_9ROSI|nr:hypothetical protein OIU84_008157 [Salix udensis]